MTLPSASQWKPVTAIRADYEFAIAFRVPPPPPPPVPPPPRRLERRCGGRHFFHDRRVDRNGARTRSTSNRKPSCQAEEEECVAHECLPGSPRRQRTALPFSSTCSARCASNPVGVAWTTHPPARGRPFQPGQSGNPRGRPRVIAELRELAQAPAPEAIGEVARLASLRRRCRQLRWPWHQHN